MIWNLLWRQGNGLVIFLNFLIFCEDDDSDIDFDDDLLDEDFDGERMFSVVTLTLVLLNCLFLFLMH